MNIVNRLCPTLCGCRLRTSPDPWPDTNIHFPPRKDFCPWDNIVGHKSSTDNNASCSPHVLVTLEYLHLQLLGLNRNKSKLWHKGRRVEHRVIISQFGWKKIQILTTNMEIIFFPGCGISRFLDNAHIEGRGQTTGQRSEGEQPDDPRGCLASVAGTFDTWAQKRFITHLFCIKIGHIYRVNRCHWTWHAGPPLTVLFLLSNLPGHWSRTWQKTRTVSTWSLQLNRFTTTPKSRLQKFRKKI